MNRVLKMILNKWLPMGGLVMMLSLCSQPLAYADVNGDLGKFFTHLGFDGNVTKGHAYQGQEAGYYSVGSAYLRNQVRNIQIIHIDAPSFQSGCGGIDLFAGAFSFINSENLVKFFRSVMSNAAGYAMNLALETNVPEIAHVAQYIQNVAQKANNSNLNSCEMGEDLVGGIWSKVRASQQKICQDIGSQNNVFSDWSAARQGCSTGGDFNQQMQHAGQDPQYKNQTVVNKNLIWSSLQANGFLSGDTELAELFMSLSGTIVYDANGKATVYFPLADNRNLIKTLLDGGSAQIYTCSNTTTCLVPNLGDLSISANDGLVEQVAGMINNLTQSVVNNTPISDQQKGFLNTLSIPLLKFITVNLSLKGGVSAVDLTKYSDLIAQNLLAQYLKGALQTVQQALLNSSYTPDVQKQLADQITQALSSVRQLKSNAHQRLQDAAILMRSERFLEAKVSANLTDHLKGNLGFSGEGL